MKIISKMSAVFPIWVIFLTFLVTFNCQASKATSDESRGLEFSSFLGNLNKVGESILSGGDNNIKFPFGNILGVAMDMRNILSNTTPAPTTTTISPSSPSPLAELGQNMDNLGQRLLESTKLAQTPIRLLNRMVAGAAEVSTTGVKSVNALTNTADSLAKVTETSTKELVPAPIIDLESKGSDSKRNDDQLNYEFLDGNEPLLLRKPKYFSRECHFRIACETGKLLKPITERMTKEVETNRFLQDLQNRYTRAFTYGSIEGNCDRYYCAFFALMTGPVGMASGMAEIFNRVANPDMYEGLSYLN